VGVIMMVWLNDYYGRMFRSRYIVALFFKYDPELKEFELMAELITKRVMVLDYAKDRQTAQQRLTQLKGIIEAMEYDEATA
jgi:hypothetical protein